MWRAYQKWPGSRKMDGLQGFRRQRSL
jgi:hypothetical protein